MLSRCVLLRKNKCLLLNFLWNENVFLSYVNILRDWDSDCFVLFAYIFYLHILLLWWFLTHPWTQEMIQLECTPIWCWTRSPLSTKQYIFKENDPECNKCLTILCWRHAGGKKTKLGILNSVYSTICKSKHLEAKVCMLIWHHQSCKLTKLVSNVMLKGSDRKKRKLLYLCYCNYVVSLYCFI